MTRSELVEKLALEKNLSLSVADRIVTEIFKRMSDALTSGDGIELRGFGSIELREYGGFTGRNPKTGLDVEVKPKIRPFFKVGKDLKERIAAGGK